MQPPQKGKAAHYEVQLKLKPKQVFQKIELLKENNDPTFSYALFNDYPDQELDALPLDSLRAKGYKVYDAGRVKEFLPPARSVIDLHIEKLTNAHDQMSNFEMLSLQLTK